MSEVRFKTPSAVVPARLDAPDLEEHDLVRGLVLPRLDDELTNPEDMKREFSADQAREIDLTALPTRMNHSNSLESVGITLAYRVIGSQDGTPAKAETLHKLHREPDDGIPQNDPVAVLCATQRNLLMSGTHAGVSLGHSFSTDYVGDLGRYDASLSGQTGRVINKRPLEISLCKKGKRPGSEILDYLPCKRSLLRTTPEHLRMFCEKYGYTLPPQQAAGDRSAWNGYIDHLWGEVKQRRAQVLSSDGYSQALKSRGIVAASSDSAAPTQPLPWRVMWEEQTSLTQQSSMTSTTNNAPTPNPAGAVAAGVPASIAAAVAAEVHNVVPNQGAPAAAGEAPPLDPLQVAFETQAVATSAMEEVKRLQAENAQYKAREAQEQQSRKRKQEEDAAQAAKTFAEQKARKRDEYQQQGNKALSQGGISEATVKAAVGNALEALEATKTLDDLAAAARVHDTSLAILEQASASAIAARNYQIQQELMNQRRNVQQWASQLPLTGGIQSSGGLAPTPAVAVVTTPAADAGTVNASASSTSSFWPTSSSVAASGSTIKAPKVDYAADDRYAQILNSHMEQNNQVPSLRQLLLGGERVEHTVNMSASGPVTQVKRTPMLSEPLPLREYSWKTTAPELFSQLTAGVSQVLAGAKPRPELSAMEEMNRCGAGILNRTMALHPISGAAPEDGFMTIRPGF